MSPHASHDGHTLIEATMVLAISAFLITAMTNLVSSSYDSQVHTQRMARLIEVEQELINDIRKELLSAVTLFQDDLTGRAYFDALQFDVDAPPLVGSRMPKAIVAPGFAKESTPGERTGNVLTLAKQAWTTEFQAGSGTRYLIDMYRFASFYLTKANSQSNLKRMAKVKSGPRPNKPDGLILAKFVSEPVADGDQIDAITDPADRTQILEHLRRRTLDVSGIKHPQVRLVWRRGRSLADPGAIREIDPLSFSLSNDPVPPRPSGSWRIEADLHHSVRDLLEFRHLSIASNYASAGHGVSRFGRKDNANDGFPHGFEIQVAGPSSTREILVHMSVVGTNRHGSRGHSEMTTVVMMKDM